MSRRKQRSAFDPASEFDGRNKVAYQDCGLSFRQIGSRVGRNQITVIRICDHWTQDRTMDRRGQSHPPQFTTSREDRQIQSGLSARLPLLGLLLKQNNRRLVSVANGALKEGCGRQNGVKLSLLTSHASVCKTTMVRFESGDTVKRGCRTPSHWLCAGYYGMGRGIGYHSPLVRITGTLNSQRYISEVLEPVVLPYLQDLATAIFQQDNARPHVTLIAQRLFVNH
ncbi:transposable element Tcb1 transposase [Trichonephila clavipes]|nr:transposable element Tcb1 transposase [Trichonephila clavipes]